MKSYNSILGQAIDQFMNQSLSDVFGVDVMNAQPSVNIREESDKHVLELAIPGISKDEIEINIEKDRLIISAEQKTEDSVENPAEKETVDFESEKKRSYERKEFDFSGFKRSFHLPQTADRNKISAAYNAGILVVNILKKEEAIDHGPINIKVS
ncbi:Hsp20/alpha crystallin family protein [Saprospiraceae bacterium]|nr:Hsp20/alpha crystallin family protein [Saprospiraceae bacterium]